MKLSFILAHLSLAIAATSAAFTTSDWTYSDARQFLEDRGIQVDKKISNSDLFRKVGEELENVKKYKSSLPDLNEAKQSILKAYEGSDKSKLEEYGSYLYLLNPFKEEDKSVKLWIFDTWGTNDLKKFLQANKAKFDKSAKRSDLIKLAQKKYEELSKKKKTSGYYLPDWVYEQWDTKDLQDWLKKQGLDYNRKDKREDLIKKVKNHAYLALKYAETQKNNFLDSLDLSRKNIFDKVGSIQDEFYDTLSKSQLQDWLEKNDLIEKGNKKLGIDDLKKIAKENLQSLLDDIRKWVSYSQEKASPIISKVPSGGKLPSDIINDTFLVGIEKWSIERLQDFLKVRNIKFSKSLSKDKLVELVKQNKNTPVTAVNDWNPMSQVFDYWSTENLNSWLNKKGENVRGSRDNLLNSAKKYFNNIVGTDKSDLSYKVDVYRPKYDEFKNSIQKTFTLRNDDYLDSDITISEDLMKSAYDAVSEYYNSATNKLGELSDDISFSIDDALSDIEEQSESYAQNFVNAYKDNIPNVKDYISDAQKTADKYTDELIQRLKAGPSKYRELFLNAFNSLYHHAYSVYSFISSSLLNFNSDILKDTKEKISTVNDAVSKGYDSYKKEAQKGGSYAASKLDDAVQKAKSFFTYLSNVELRTYLESYGYDVNWLSTLKRRQLIALANWQSDLFYGTQKSSWDKSFTELISGPSNRITDSLGLTSKKSYSWTDKIRSYVPFF